MKSIDYRSQVLKPVIEALKQSPLVLGAWEGGSAANRTSDQYSDIDLSVLAAEPVNLVFEIVEKSLNSVSQISHIWNEPKSIWPQITQKIYFITDAPQHFFVDVAVFPEGEKEILEEFMQVERHGNPVVYFDKSGRVKGRKIDEVALREKRRKRLEEILEAFPVYRTSVLKELDRGHSVAAFAYYNGGMLRPLVEVLGMVFRPDRFDFGFRYLERDFPGETYGGIEKFLYVKDMDGLRENVGEVEKLFYETVETIREKLEGE